MTDDYMKFLAMATVMPMVPKPIQKKILFEMLNDSKIKLSESELKLVEHQYRQKPDCISIAYIPAWMFNWDSWSELEFADKIKNLKKTLEALEDGKY